MPDKIAAETPPDAQAVAASGGTPAAEKTAPPPKLESWSKRLDPFRTILDVILKLGGVIALIAAATGVVVGWITFGTALKEDHNTLKILKKEVAGQREYLSAHQPINLTHFYYLCKERGGTVDYNQKTCTYLQTQHVESFRYLEFKDPFESSP